MSDLFISYATADQKTADFIAQHLESEGISVFQAGISLKGGDQWSEQIKTSLRCSSLVLFLASKTACKSAAVQQEIGAAMFSGKKLVPVLMGITPEELPAWAKECQAVDFNLLCREEIKEYLSNLAQELKQGKGGGAILCACLLAGLALWAISE